MSDDEQVRIGTAEREQALSALADHHAAGRLDADEYEDRRGRANDAITRGDLTALFADLPGGKPTFGATSTPSTSNPGPVSASTPMNRDERRAQRRADRANGIRSGQPTRWRGVVALSPFVALALFFLTGSWLWFLLVPVSGIVVGMFGRDND
ncbi:MAG: DUF1707 domain-containing protein [Humibacillus sp.]|nr:DUF1707 domain-containing protein [Humibacillus sp.]MDN5775756.1 DUF1707 domain-containing protein [Humibacillus sp.]